MDQNVTDNSVIEILNKLRDAKKKILKKKKAELRYGGNFKI